MSRSRSTRALTAAVCLVALLAFSSVSLAISVNPENTVTYLLTAHCADCVEPRDSADTFEYVTATLKLQNFDPSVDAGPSTEQFLSFSYSGSSLVEAFTVTSDQWEQAVVKSIAGRLTEGDSADFSFMLIATSQIYTCTAEGLEYLGLGICQRLNSTMKLLLESDGGWSLGIAHLDVGDQFDITRKSAAGAIPAPGTLGLLALGIVGIRYRRRYGAL